MNNQRYWILIIIIAVMAGVISWSSTTHGSFFYIGITLSFMAIILAAIAERQKG